VFWKVSPALSNPSDDVVPAEQRGSAPRREAFDDGQELLKAAERHCLEGVVSKRRDWKKTIFDR